MYRQMTRNLLKIASLARSPPLSHQTTRIYSWRVAKNYSEAVLFVAQGALLCASPLQWPEKKNDWISSVPDEIAPIWGMLLDSFQAEAQNNVPPMAVGKLPVPRPAASNWALSRASKLWKLDHQSGGKAACCSKDFGLGHPTPHWPESLRPDCWEIFGNTPCKWTWPRDAAYNLQMFNLQYFIDLVHCLLQAQQPLFEIEDICAMFHVFGADA